MSTTPPFPTPSQRPSSGRPGTPSAAASPAVRVTPEQAREEQIGKTCSTCGTGISRGEMVVTCPLCSLPYHHDCWKEIGGCGTYGCKAAPAVTKTEQVAEDTFTPGWTGEKKCPACQSNILANALICKYCKAVFPTERPMTTTEWASREYDGPELVRLRNLVIAQFVVSALGCLFFLSLPANLIALFTESWVFEVKRLPPSLRILFYAGVGISGLWAALALSFGAYSVIF